MPAIPITASVATLAVADPASCDRAALAELAAEALRVRGWLDAFEASIAAAAAHLAEPADVVLAADGRRSGRDARAAAERGVACELMPELHSALAAGTVSAGHVDAVARAAGRLDDDARDDLVALAGTLVASAASTSVEAFERQVRDLERRLSRDDGIRQHERLREQRSLRRWIDRQTGLAHTHLALDPESDAKLSAALDAAVAAERARSGGDETRTFEQLRADAFVAQLTAPGGGGRRPAEVSVLVDLRTIESGSHAQSVCETADGQPIPPETVRRLACDAAIIPITLGGDGRVLDHGTARRTASNDQRRALRAMYRACGHPGCDVRFNDCQVHHVVEWIRQRGPTNLDNLLPLCSRHHHLVHEGGWHLSLRPDRTIRLVRPDGSVAFDGSTVDVAPAGTVDATPIGTTGGELRTALAEAVAAAEARRDRARVA
jgi:hypothetical protein